METVSRFIECVDKAFVYEKGGLKEGQETINVKNQYGVEDMIIIVNFHKGKLHSLTDTPAVQCTDAHTEYWENGQISNKRKDKDGNPLPAVISNYGDIVEFWEEGNRIS